MTSPFSRLFADNFECILDAFGLVCEYAVYGDGNGPVSFRAVLAGSSASLSLSIAGDEAANDLVLLAASSETPETINEGRDRITIGNGTYTVLSRSPIHDIAWQYMLRRTEQVTHGHRGRR